MPFATKLVAHGVELVSTGGTAKAIADAGLPVKDVSELTGFPEMMDGRVKTLHPKVHGGILAIRADAGHQASLAEHAIAPIDLVVVNLYPFEATVARKADFEETIENIDIGGPSMIRGAAKNHNDVAVVVEAVDYEAVLKEIAEHGGTTLALRRKLAQKAYARTAAYDAAGHLQLVRPRAEGGCPRLPRLRRQAHRGAALRREPAPVGRLLRLRRDPSRRRHRAAGAGQAALLQQHQRHRRRLRGGGRVPIPPARRRW